MPTASSALDHPVWKVRCVRIKKDGTQCQKWAIRGGTVCPKHGGRAPNTARKAAERISTLREQLLNELAPRAISTLSDLLSSENESVALRAAADILDRAGLAPVRETKTSTTLTVHSDLDDQIASLFDKMHADATHSSAIPADAVPLPPSLPPLPPATPQHAALEAIITTQREPGFL